MQRLASHILFPTAAIALPLAACVPPPRDFGNPFVHAKPSPAKTVEMANAAPDPQAALQILAEQLPSNDPAISAHIEKRGAELVAFRQAEHQRNRTYRDPSNGHRDTSMGRCVVATQPFGLDAMPNPKLTIVVRHSDQHVYARCYTRGMARPKETIVASAGVWAIRDIETGNTVNDDFYVDFEFPTKGSSDRASVQDFEIDAVWADDNKIVLDPGGTLRVRPDVQHRPLAMGSYIYIP